MEIFKENSTVKTIYDDKELYDRSLDALKRIRSTPPDKSSNNIDSWFSYESDVNSLTIGSRTLIKCSLLKLLVILAEVDLMSKFISRFESAVKLQEYSPFRWLVQARLKMPVTITNREVIILGFGCINPEDHTIFVPFRSVNKQYYSFIPLPNENPKFLRIEILFGFFNIKYIDEETVEVINCYNVDPKVSVIPWFILNTFLRKISYYIMEDLKKQIEKVDFKIYDERIAKNKEFYDKVIMTLKENFNQTSKQN